MKMLYKKSRLAINKKLITLTLIFCALGCAKLNKAPTYTQSIDEKIVNEISYNVAQELKKEKGLIPFGSGGRMLNEIKMLHLAFQYNEFIDIETGRKLLLDASKLFLQRINQDERIRPYLANYPFEPKNIEIEIFTPNQLTEKNPAHLVLINMSESKLTYEVDDPKGTLLKTIYEEKYEDALQNRL